MTILALVWGILAFLAFVLGLIPCLGWLNWLNIPFAIAGVVIAIVAMSQASAERRPVGAAIGGLLLSLTAVVIGMFRLLMGGGVL